MKSLARLPWFKRMILPVCLLLCGIVLLWSGLRVVRANVILSGPILAEAGQDGITIRWTTGTEFDTQLFYLLRSTTEQGPFQPVPICLQDHSDGDGMVNAVFAQGDISGFRYAVTDLAIDLNSSNQRVDDLVDGTTYYYLLVEKDAGGYVSFPTDIAVATYSPTGGGPTPSTQPCPIASTLPGIAPISLFAYSLYLPAIQR